MKFVPMCSSRCGMLCSLWLHERPGAAAISSWAAKVQAPGFGSHKDFHGFPVVEVVRSCFWPFVYLQVNMSESFVLTCFLHFLPLFFAPEMADPAGLWSMFLVGYLQVALVLVVLLEEAFTLQAGVPREAASIPVAVITPTWSTTTIESIGPAWCLGCNGMQWLHLTSFDPFSAHCTLKHDGATWSHMEPLGF